MRRKWKTVWKELLTLERQMLGICVGHTKGIIKLQERINKRGEYVYKVTYKADGYPSRKLDLDVFELSYPEVAKEYIIDGIARY